MKDRRLEHFWYRAGPLAAAGALLTGGAVMGCGSDSPTTTSTGTTTTTTTGSTGGAGGMMTTTEASSTSSTSSSGTGGAGGAPHALALGSVADGHRPFDAAPNADGSVVFFTADGANGLGVYKVPADGSAPMPAAVYPTAVDPANPFAAPFGVAVSTDGKTVFVADPAAGPSDRGAIYAVPVGGGTPKMLSGTDGFAPRSLDVVAVGGLDTLYFSGTDAKVGGLPGIFSVPASGGMVTSVSVGGVLHDPSGLTVAKDGAIYLIDTVASANHTSQILVIPSGGSPKVLMDDVRVGYPAGVAISVDDKTLYVSGFNPHELTDRLLVVDIAASKLTETFMVELGAFTESGGLHRAASSDIFALVDSSAGPKAGKVFVIK